MVSRAYTVTFDGIDACPIEVECAVAPGLPSFSIVGLPDKAVSEARERIRASFAALSLAMPAKRITVNLIPADRPKIGAHYDLPIALAILAEMQVCPKEAIEEAVALGELSLDGRLNSVNGALPTAIYALEQNKTLLCPAACGSEAAWVQDANVIAPNDLRTLVDHLTGRKVIDAAKAGEVHEIAPSTCLSDIKGQERAKRALEIAAAGRHHLLLVGTPGSGKTMLATRAQGLLPELTPSEALETSLIYSVAGLMNKGGINRTRPFRAPHHTASTPAIVGGGRTAGPGEISLAHNGILFLDEFPEFPRNTLETLRQPLESGSISIARANAHVTYPSKFMLIAAANPCRCGYLPLPEKACARVPLCGQEYLGRISGPLLDRFDLRLDVPPVALADLETAPSGETSTEVAARVRQARLIQSRRYASIPDTCTNADATGDLIDKEFLISDAARALISHNAERLNISARSYHRILRVGRTIADLDGCDTLERHHIAEALSYRLIGHNDTT